MIWNNFFFRGKVAVFTILCKQYRICISRDPSYEQYLDKIGQLFFNVAPARPRNQGIFGSLLQSFFDGLGDEEFNVEEQNAASTSQAGQELDWLIAYHMCAAWM